MTDNNPTNKHLTLPKYLLKMSLSLQWELCLMLLSGWGGAAQHKQIDCSSAATSSQWAPHSCFSYSMLGFSATLSRDAGGLRSRSWGSGKLFRICQQKLWNRVSKLLNSHCIKIPKCFWYFSYRQEGDSNYFSYTAQEEAERTFSSSFFRVFLLFDSTFCPVGLWLAAAPGSGNMGAVQRTCEKLW